MDAILYIDDDVSNLTGFKFTFKNVFKIFIAQSASEGWDILNEQDIKVVIADQRMPETTGVEMLEKVAVKFPHIVRIILTAYTDVEDIIAAINKGRIFRFIQKPWDKDELKVILDNAIYTYDLRKRNDELIQELKESNSELETLNKNLEEEVKKRTEKIHLQNQELELHKNHLEELVKKRTYELESAKIKAEQSDQLKSAFMANMSHEIRTPLNAIVGFTSIISDPDLTDDSRDKYAGFINDSASTLSVLINDIMDISLIDTNQLILAKDYFDAGNILSERLDYYSLNNPNNLNIVFENIMDEEPLVLHNDVVRFKQVITNLLDNALKYTDVGSVRYGYKRLDNEVIFHVHDTGVGIDEENHKLIFNQFQKIEYPERLYPGTGIGLAICKSLVELMDGKIWVDSTLGKGSAFYFTMPYQEKESEELEEEDTSTVNTSNFDELTVLVAEDDPLNYQLVADVLERVGAKVYWAKNGIEAVDFIKQNPDISNCIILMDIKMPEMDGYEAHRTIKDMQPSIPVIAVTAHAQAKDSTKIIQEKFNDFLAKPYQPEGLLGKIANFF